MAVFTAIAAVITGAISGAGFAAAFAAAGTLTGLGIATSLVAGGLAIATAKAFAPKVPNSQAAKDPGVKIQLAPGTDNRIPVFYGRITTGAIATDAGISNQNETMTYVLILSEMTDSGTYTVHKIYRGDAQLNFNGATVISLTDPNATSSTDVNGKMRCRVYAGGTAASNQIFPTTGAVAATTLLPTIDVNTNYDDLVYAVFQMDYDPENGLTGLGTLSFEIENSLNEPSNVLLDYLQNDRYGAGLSSSELDLSSFNDLYDYSTAQVDYINAANATVSHNRWQIDGMLSTHNVVKENIDQLCQSCATFFTYDPKGGVFRVVPNRAATTAEKSAAYLFDNNNILSRIDIGSTELYSLYNSIEAEFPALSRKDQTSTTICVTDPADRNTNEPDNPLTVRFNLVNDAPRAHNLANIDLRQSRTSLTVSFEADYSAIQVDVGDVVKLTEPTYGFNQKLFRVMRVTEMEKPDGMLSVKVILLEYSDDVYEHNVIQTVAEPGTSGIPGWWWINPGIIPDIGNITLVDNPGGDTANIVDPTTGGVVGNVDLGDIDWPTFPGLPGVNPWVNFPITMPADIGGYYNEMELEVNPTVTGVSNPSKTVITYKPQNGNTFFRSGEVVNVAVPLTGLGESDTINTPSVTAISANVRMRGTTSGIKSNTSSTTSIVVDPKNFIPKESVGTFTAGVQFEDTPPNNTSVVSGTTFLQITPTELYDLRGAEIGDYSINAFGTLGGSITGTFDVGFAVAANLTFANATSANTIPISYGVNIHNITDFPPQLTATGKISTDVNDYVTAYPAYNFSSDMKASNVSIALYGYSDIGTSPAPRSFGNMKYEMLKVTKGEKQ